MNAVAIAKQIALINDRLGALPVPVLNLITLHLKNGGVTTDVEALKLSVKPEDFKIRGEALREKLLRSFAESRENFEKHTATWAYVILDRSGINEILDATSRSSTKQALTRLLLNGDENAVRRFLETLSDSIVAAEPTASPVS